MAVDYVNERNMLGPSHTLTYVFNSTQLIATTEGIQLGECSKSESGTEPVLQSMSVISSLHLFVNSSGM